MSCTEYYYCHLLCCYIYKECSACVLRTRGSVNNASATLFVSHDIKTILQRFKKLLQHKLINLNMFKYTNFIGGQK